MTGDYADYVRMARKHLRWATASPEDVRVYARLALCHALSAESRANDFNQRREAVLLIEQARSLV